MRRLTTSLKLVELTAYILVSNRQHFDLDEARNAVLSTFKEVFPYWSFADWNMDIPVTHAKTILKMYEGDSKVTVKQLVTDLPAIATAFKNGS